MAEHAEGAGSTEGTRRSRLYDYADVTGGVEAGATDPGTTETETADPGTTPDGKTTSDSATTSVPATTPNSATTASEASGMPAAEGARRHREFAVLLGEFRRTPVLVPVDREEAPLTADFGGVRWIYAFSDEGALARFASARGEGDREWAYQRWLGARLLDAAVPAVGVPCGVALDCADGADGGVLFPPVRGVVPDEVAVDVDSGAGAEK
ncbi:hypothetical protein [Streptomyces actinomycinicus]|uniref:hypothetical protein n=1 Tax=Streptomyces actinomycinicus TaxID=1695166 RepID=UPI001F2BF643|nr:hypothetical protein [Streptomyces actinomycinicus]